MAIVFFTTIVLGAVMPLYIKFHIKRIEARGYERLASEI